MGGEGGRGSTRRTHCQLCLTICTKHPSTNPHSVGRHPAAIKLGLLYRAGAVREDDDRVAALLATFCNVISDYKTPTGTNKSLPHAWTSTDGAAGGARMPRM